MHNLLNKIVSKIKGETFVFDNAIPTSYIYPLAELN